MNAPLDQYPSIGSSDFSSIVASSAVGIRSNFTSLQSSTLVPISMVLYGIANSVAQSVAERALDLSPSLRQRINEMSDLRPNWDGEKAKVVKTHVLADVIEVLMRFRRRAENFQEPFLAPTFDGFVQMEWHNEKRSLEIEAVDKGWSLVGTITDERGSRDYFTAECERSDFQKLQMFYDWYMGIEWLWPLQ